MKEKDSNRKWDSKNKKKRDRRVSAKHNHGDGSVELMGRVYAGALEKCRYLGQVRVPMSSAGTWEKMRDLWPVQQWKADL
jgi:hypothetical protein